MMESAEGKGERFFIAEDGRWVDDPLVRRVSDGRRPLWSWARREAAVRYQQSFLGVAWVLLQPALNLLVIGFVVTRVFGIGGDGVPYVPFAYAGLSIWAFTTSTIGLGIPSLVNSIPIISKVYFPREIVPLSVAVANAIDLGLGAAILVVLAVVSGIPAGPTLLALPLSLALAWVSVAAVTTLGAALTVFIRDLRHLVPFALQLGFFATPVMYPTSLLPDGARWIATANPVAVAIEAARDTALRGTWPEWPALLIHLILSGLLLILASAYMRTVEPRLAEVA